MAFLASYNSRMYVGSIGWHAYVRGINVQDSSAMLDSTVIVDTSFNYIPGMEQATVSVDMLLDGSGAAGSQFATLNTWKGAAQTVTILNGGTTRGTECLNISALQSSFTVSSPVNDVVAASGALQTASDVDWGVVLDPPTAITTNTTATSVNNGAASTNGGVAHLHVTAFSGLTSDTITLEHSTDNSSFSTLATFAVVSGTTSERLVIAGTINQYVRVEDTVVGTGTCNRIVTLARR